MNRKMTWLERMFVALMLVFCLFMAAFVLARARLDFQMEDTARSLETSQGRERKQQYEYDQVTEQLPRTQAELAETQPKADAAAEEVTRLKAQRKQLRAEKKELEEKAQDE